MNVELLARYMAVATAVLYLAFDAYVIAFSVGLPPFIVLENIVYAAAYGVLALMFRDPRVRVAGLAVAAFNLGRVSRSVVEADGSLAPLAAQHLPLIAWLALLTAVLAAASFKGVRGVG